MGLGVFFFILLIFLFNTDYVSSLGKIEHQKILLISAENIPLMYLKSVDAKLSAFQQLIQEGCLISDIYAENLTSSAEIHSLLMSGGLYSGPESNDSLESQCDSLILSKTTTPFEPLWLANQRLGMKSASFFWPDDYVAVNDSRPYLTSGSNPTFRSAYFDIERINQWLTDPYISFISICIPSPPLKQDVDFTLAYVEYTDEFLSSLLSHIKNSPNLNTSVSILFVGGSASMISQSEDQIVALSSVFNSWPASAFGKHFRFGPVIEFWPIPDEVDEALLRIFQEENEDFFTCSTAEFRNRHPDVATGLLPPYYLVAKPGKVFQVGSEVKVPESTFALLWGPAFVTSDTAPDMCGGGTEKSSNFTMYLSDFYPLICWALHVSRPLTHWGNLSRVSRLLREPPSAYEMLVFEGKIAIGNGAGGGLSKRTIFATSLICTFVLVFVIIFVVCAIRFNKRYQRMSNQNGYVDATGIGNVRFHKHRLHRPWKATSSSNPERSHRLLDNVDGFQGDLEQEEEEVVVMDNDRQKKRNDARTFIQMLHSPPGNGRSRLEPAVRRA